jgi:hypothetical protein
VAPHLHVSGGYPTSWCLGLYAEPEMAATASCHVRDIPLRTGTVQLA